MKTRYDILIGILTAVLALGIAGTVHAINWGATHDSYSVAELNSAPKPEGYLFTTTDKDGNIVADGMKMLTKEDTGVTGQKIIATTVPCSGPEDGMIYTTFTGHGEKDGKTYEVLYINQPKHNGEWVAASITDPEGNTTLYTFMYNGETVYDKLK